jgi:hypothetical protein
MSATVKMIAAEVAAIIVIAAALFGAAVIWADAVEASAAAEEAETITVESVIETHGPGSVTLISFEVGETVVVR